MREPWDGGYVPFLGVQIVADGLAAMLQPLALLALKVKVKESWIATALDGLRGHARELAAEEVAKQFFVTAKIEQATLIFPQLITAADVPDIGFAMEQ